MAPGEWISIAGMAGTAVAAFFGLRLGSARNTDALKSLSARVEGVEQSLSNGRFASRELVEARIDAVDKRLGRIEGTLDRIEGTSGCHYPNCPPGYARGTREGGT